MSRWWGYGIGMATLAAGWMVVPPAPVKGAEKAVEFIRFGSGSRLGLVLDDVGGDDVTRLKLSEERGALVKEVEDGSAAEKAGVKKDDVIVRYQGEAVHSAVQLTRLVRETPAGRKVALEVVRDGAPQRLTATLGKGGGRFFAEGEFPHFEFTPPEPPEPPDPPELPDIEPLLRWEGKKGRGLVLRDPPALPGPRKLGISYQEISGQLARYFKLDAERGILVSEVDENGPAGKAGMKAGDVIVKFDGKVVGGSGDLRRELARKDPGTEVTVTVQRDGRPVDLKLNLGGERPARRRGTTT